MKRALLRGTLAGFGITIVAYYSWGLGVAYGMGLTLSRREEKPLTYNRVYMYNVYMLKKCLIELKSLKGGE